MFDSNNNKAFRDLQELMARKMKLVSEQKAPASSAGSDKKTEFNTSKEPSEKPFNVSEESPEKGERVPGPWNEIDDPVKMPAPIPPRTGDSGPAIAPKYPPAPPGYKSQRPKTAEQVAGETLLKGVKGVTDTIRRMFGQSDEADQLQEPVPNVPLREVPKKLERNAPRKQEFLKRLPPNAGINPTHLVPGIKKDAIGDGDEDLTPEQQANQDEAIRAANNTPAARRQRGEEPPRSYWK
jgi:hypothetical protein